MNDRQNAFFSRFARKTSTAKSPLSLGSSDSSSSPQKDSNSMQVTINVNFPALDNLVNYLNSNAQAKIDALAKTVQDLTNKLNLSEVVLAESEVQSN